MVMVMMGSPVVSIKTHQLEHRSLYPEHLNVTSTQFHELLYMSLDSRAVFSSCDNEGRREQTSKLN